MVRCEELFAKGSFRVMSLKFISAQRLLSFNNFSLSCVALPAVHWGYFSKTEAPVLTVESGDEIVVEMATHHACDDYDKMIKGDEGMEDIYLWDSAGRKSEAFRGATGGGDGVHILTGSIFVNGNSNNY